VDGTGFWLAAVSSARSWSLKVVEAPSASTGTSAMARDIERIGDRATDIAEAARYLVSGVPVE
jgi:phosphate uptake regulator